MSKEGTYIRVQSEREQQKERVCLSVTCQDKTVMPSGEVAFVLGNKGKGTIPTAHKNDDQTRTRDHIPEPVSVFFF